MIYESAKSRGLRGNVGWVAQIFTWVAWVTWIKIFFTWVVWVNFFAWVAWFQNFCVSQIFYFVFAWVSFYLLDDIILLYYNYSLDIFFVSLFPANLDQHCLTSLVFLSGLLEIYKIDGIQWHFYERVTSSTWELQTDLSLKEDASTAKPLYPFMETFSRKKIS